MITIKSDKEIELMRKAGYLVSLTHQYLKPFIKPGITGLWQVSGRSTITSFEDVVALDRKYIKEWSLINDIKIILKTIKVVILHKDAY